MDPTKSSIVCDGSAADNVATKKASAGWWIVPCYLNYVHRLRDRLLKQNAVYLMRPQSIGCIAEVVAIEKWKIIVHWYLIVKILFWCYATDYMLEVGIMWQQCLRVTFVDWNETTTPTEIIVMSPESLCVQSSAFLRTLLVGEALTTNFQLHSPREKCIFVDYTCDLGASTLRANEKSWVAHIRIFEFSNETNCKIVHRIWTSKSIKTRNLTIVVWIGSIAFIYWKSATGFSIASALKMLYRCCTQAHNFFKSTFIYEPIRHCFDDTVLTHDENL